jgi:hypothetical protein
MPHRRTDRLGDTDGELGAEDLAEVTGGATLGRDDLGGMVSLEIESARRHENVSRAELDAVRATLAALLENMDRAPDAGNALRVKRDPPEPF